MMTSHTDAGGDEEAHCRACINRSYRPIGREGPSCPIQHREKTTRISRFKYCHTNIAVRIWTTKML